MNIITIIIAILFIHFTYNFIYLLRIISVEKLYLKWVESNCSNKFYKIFEYKPFFKDVAKFTGVNNNYFVSSVEPVGYGYIQTGKLNVIENFPSNQVDMYHITCRIFSEIIGVLKERLWGTINPIYWLNVIIFLPQKIVKYLGLKETSILTKILNLLWWFIAIPIALLQEFFSDKLKVLVEKLFN